MSSYDEIAPGLGTQPRKEWQKLSKAEAKQKPITLLRPGSVRHGEVLTYLMKRLEQGERAMSNFYPRWRANEIKLQAYISLPKWEQKLKEMNDSGEPAKVTSITVPYSFATLSTIVTYLIHTFAGRKPIFQLGTYDAARREAAEAMELVLQYNAEHTRLIKHFYQFLHDSNGYGLAVMRTAWKKDARMTTIWKEKPVFSLLPGLGTKRERIREKRVIYEGNSVICQDPFMFYPDPRVPMCEVNKRGEYVWWRSYEGLHIVKELQSEGIFHFVDSVPRTLPANKYSDGGESNRALLSQGASTPGLSLADDRAVPYMQLDQGSIAIIPAELGLGESTRVEKWIFTIANKQQIVQAEPLALDHGMHPVVVTEPYTLGYGFGQPGMMDFIGPLQDTISWFVNSHIANVRTVLNNMLIVDPTMIEMKDLKNPDAGLLVRLKPAAYGQDVRKFVHQLEVRDVTQNHVNDVQMLFKIADVLSGVNDNMRGQQDAGGRKTATEVRASGEAGASRLAALTRVISAQAICDLAEQMSTNVQQFISDEFLITVLGKKGAEIQITPELLAGDFNFPVHDGTLPIDRIAMVDVWKEIFLAVGKDPQLRQEYNLGKIFEHVASLGGAKDIDAMKMQGQEPGAPAPPGVDVMPDAEAAAQAQAGNIVPLTQSGRTPGLAGPAAGRMAGGLS